MKGSSAIMNRTSTYRRLLDAAQTALLSRRRFFMRSVTGPWMAATVVRIGVLAALITARVKPEDRVAAA